MFNSNIMGPIRRLIGSHAKERACRATRTRVVSWSANVFEDIVVDVDIVDGARKEVATSSTTSRFPHTSSCIDGSEAERVSGVAHNIVTENQIVHCTAGTCPILILGS